MEFDDERQPALILKSEVRRQRRQGLAGARSKEPPPPPAKERVTCERSAVHVKTDKDEPAYINVHARYKMEEASNNIKNRLHTTTESLCC